MSLKSWLLTSPIEDAFFFTNIRKTARAFHLWRGHRWAENWATATITIGTNICEIKFRRCIDCDRKEMMNEKGEWVERQTTREFWMDNVGDLALEATELIKNRLREYNVELKDMQEDEFYTIIIPASDSPYIFSVWEARRQYTLYHFLTKNKKNN